MTALYKMQGENSICFLPCFLYKKRYSISALLWMWFLCRGYKSREGISDKLNYISCFTNTLQLIQNIKNVQITTRKGAMHRPVNANLSVITTPPMESSLNTSRPRVTGIRKATIERIRAFSAPNLKSRGMTMLPKKFPRICLRRPRQQ